MLKARRQRQWLLSATTVTTAAGLVACMDQTLGCNGFYACSESDTERCSSASSDSGSGGSGPDSGSGSFGWFADGAAADAEDGGQEADAERESGAGPEAGPGTEADAGPAADAGSDASATSDATGGTDMDARWNADSPAD
jgi:hypothetical protein